MTDNQRKGILERRAKRDIEAVELQQEVERIMARVKALQQRHAQLLRECDVDLALLEEDGYGHAV
jgi:hypothetical protein